MDADDSPESFLRAARRGRMIKAFVVLVLVGGAATAVIWYFATRDERGAVERAGSERLTEPETIELAWLKQEHRRGVDAAREAWRSSFAFETLANFKVGQDRCPTLPPTLSGTARSDYVNGTAKQHPAPEFRSVIYQQPDRQIGDPEVLEATARRIEALESHVASGTATKSDLVSARAFKRPSGMVLLILGPHDPPGLHGATFEPGRVTGLAYLYSYDQHRITCFAVVNVTSSQDVAVGVSGSGGHQQAVADLVLSRDFEVELWKALAADLRAVPK